MATRREGLVDPAHSPTGRRLMIVRFRAGPAWGGGPLAAQPGWPAHEAFVEQLVRRGTVVQEGPFTDGSGAMLVVDGLALDDARRLIEYDPLVESGVLELEDVREWTLLVDNSSPSSSSSAGRYSRRGRRLRIAASLAISTTIGFLTLGFLVASSHGHGSVAVTALVFALIPAALVWAAWRYLTAGFLIAPLALPGLYGLSEVDRYTAGGSPASVLVWSWVTVAAPLVASALFMAAHLDEAWTARRSRQSASA